MLGRLPLATVVLVLVACGGARPQPLGDAVASGPRPDAPGQGAGVAPPTAADRCAPDAAADRALMALVGQGLALADHVGPDAAAAIDADLAARPAVYLTRFECQFVAPDADPALASLFIELPLWRLRASDPDRVGALAARLGYRLDELARRPADPADPGFGERVAERAQALALIVGGVDVAMAPSWTAPVPGDVAACVTATVDGAPVVRVTRACSCGEVLGCRATARGRGLALDVRYDPASPAMCTDCYATTTACTLPALPASATVDVTANGARLARWATDAAGLPTAAACR